MADANTDLFLHLIKRGLDRAYAVAEEVTPRYDGLSLDVILMLTPEQLRAADWSNVARVEVQFQAQIEGTNDHDVTVAVPMTATRFDMKQRLERGLDAMYSS